jgi:hypothetical protein
MNWKKFILLSCVVSCVFAISIATAQMRGHRAPMLNSASRFHRFNRFNDGDFDRDDRFRHFRRFNNRTFIFVDTFGFPFFYPYPYYGCYPYDYYGYNDSGYGYGNTVVEVQRRLARAGYYHGAIDGIMGPQTRRAIRAYERDHNQRAYGMTDRY